MNNDIREKKLIYHLTGLENMRSILANGLLPRASLNGFVDVADVEIIEDRKRLRLERYVPFHFFAKNPFDGRVQPRPSQNAVRAHSRSTRYCTRERLEDHPNASVGRWRN